MALLAPELAALSPLLWLAGSFSVSDVLHILLPGVPVILLLAAGAGFLAPCRLDDTYEQVLSFALLGALLAGVLATVSWVSPRLAALDVPGSLSGAGLVLAVAALGLATGMLTENSRRKS